MASVYLLASITDSPSVAARSCAGPLLAGVGLLVGARIALSMLSAPRSPGS